MRGNRAFVLIAAVCLIASPLAAEGDDPHLGTWKLVQERSKPAKGSAKPQRVPAVLKIRPVENGHRFVSILITGDGQGVRTEYTARYDGKEYPRTVAIDGKAWPSTVSIRKIDHHTLEQTFRDANGSTTVQVSVVSKNGRKRTNTITFMTAEGETAKLISVYERLEIF